jgi:simple sugar transport system permease protein
MGGYADIFTMLFLVNFLAATVRIATPLLLIALGETFSQKAGVFNIGLEGIVLIGAFSGFVFSYYLNNAWLGILCSVLVCMLVAYLSGLLMIGVGADQIVTGLALNIFAIGVTSSFYRYIFGILITTRPEAPSLSVMPIPLLQGIPFLGPILFRQLPLVYLALALVPVCWFVLFRTHLGLKIRAVGENPHAAKTLGIDVKRIRYLCILLVGVSAGLAGSFLSIGHFNTFFDNMSGGRGFIAIAIVIFGKWNPLGSLIGALLFGSAYAFQLRLQAMGVNLPYQFLLMMPYILTIIALAMVKAKATAPTALGKPFVE